MLDIGDVPLVVAHIPVHHILALASYRHLGSKEAHAMLVRSHIPALN